MDKGYIFQNKFCYLKVNGEKKISKINMEKIIELFYELNKEQEDKQKTTKESKR